MLRKISKTAILRRGAWEAFYTRNKQQLKDNGEEPVQELNKRLPRFFTLGKAYRTAAAVLILVAACAIVWSIVSKQKKNDAGAITQKSPGSSADTAGYVAIDIQRDTVGVTTRHLVNDSNPFFPGETLYGTTGNNSRKETDPPIIEERNIHSAVEEKAHCR
ncbi:hypothetical protein LWM68_22525 [Niabella sp. W65]|nr:hypothetical protein [Niabella sp. W65]MCH7365291.1 hypothetical protein [Niabella sp. W65]ULT41085.1 hypothetical protein KRR40_41395 [Niabella sp. I65]